MEWDTSYKGLIVSCEIYWWWIFLVLSVRGRQEGEVRDGSPPGHQWAGRGEVLSWRLWPVQWHQWKAEGRGAGQVCCCQAPRLVTLGSFGVASVAFLLLNIQCMCWASCLQNFYLCLPFFFCRFKSIFFGVVFPGGLSQYVIQPMPGIKYSAEETPVLCYVRLLMAHLSCRSAIQRLGAAAVLREWALTSPGQECHPFLQTVLHACLTEIVYYDEIALSFTRYVVLHLPYKEGNTETVYDFAIDVFYSPNIWLNKSYWYYFFTLLILLCFCPRLQQDTKDFMAMLRHYKLPLDDAFTSAPVLTLEQVWPSSYLY